MFPLDPLGPQVTYIVPLLILASNHQKENSISSLILVFFGVYHEGTLEGDDFLT